MIFQTRIAFWEYSEALAAMQAHVALLAQKKANEEIWFLEHLPVYTMGPCTAESDVPVNSAKQEGIAIVRTNRGGQATYHGPGQRVVYALIDLKQRQISVYDYIRHLERWIIQALKSLGVCTQTLEGQTGVWLSDGKQKIASLGVRISSGIAFHGFALNVSNPLQPFQQIVACGNHTTCFTSLSQVLHRPIQMTEIDLALIKHCPFQDDSLA